MQGKVALVTGAGRGLGRDIAIALAQEGVQVAVNAAHEETAEATTQLIQSKKGHAFPICADVSNRDEVYSMVDTIHAELGRIDFLINNAAVFVNKPSLQLSDTDWHKTLGVNLTGPFLCCQAIVPHMIEAGGGNIVNISSTAGLVGFPERLPYSVSKAALIMLTKVLAIEWAPFNIQVNGVAPGPMKTEMVLQRIEKGVYTEAQYTRRIPMARIAEPVEVARTVVFLVSKDSSYMTGHTLVVDGGWTAYGYL